MLQIWSHLRWELESKSSVWWSRTQWAHLQGRGCMCFSLKIRDIMGRYSPMDKLELGKLTPWRVLAKQKVSLNKQFARSLERSSETSRMEVVVTSPSSARSCKSIMSVSTICLTCRRQPQALQTVWEFDGTNAINSPSKISSSSNAKM